MLSEIEKDKHRMIDLIYNYACWSCYGRREECLPTLFYISGGGLNHHLRLSNNKISISFLDVSPELKFICPTSSWTLLLGCPTASCAKMDTLLLSLTSNLLLFQYYLSFYLSLGLVPSSIYPPKQTPNSLPQHCSLFPNH